MSATETTSLFTVSEDPQSSRSRRSHQWTEQLAGRKAANNAVARSKFQAVVGKDLRCRVNSSRSRNREAARAFRLPGQTDAVGHSPPIKFERNALRFALSWRASAQQRPVFGRTGKQACDVMSTTPRLLIHAVVRCAGVLGAHRNMSAGVASAHALHHAGRLHLHGQDRSGLVGPSRARPAPLADAVRRG